MLTLLTAVDILDFILTWVMSEQFSHWDLMPMIFLVLSLEVAIPCFDDVINPGQLVLTLFMMGIFGAAHGWGGQKCPFPKICHTYPTMMKLGTVTLTQRRSKKYINHVTQPLSSADISIFSPKISKFCYIKKYRYRLHFDT